MHRYLILLLITLFAVPAWAHHDETLPTPQRVPPMMPDEAQVSGYCCLIYDIDAEGQTVNISANYCSEDYYAIPSKAAISRWRYSGRRSDGRDLTTSGERTYMTFVLNDDQGPIPGRNGFMRQLPDSSFDRRYTCGELIS